MIIQRLSSALILVSTLLASEAARADDNEASYSVFTYGDTCENLGQLSRVELVGITHQTYSEQFAIFCKPDSVYRCEDYDSALVGLGRLEDNGRGSCRYLPNAKG